MHTYTSLWVSKSGKVGLHLQQQQHIKNPLSVWQAGHDVIMPAKLSCAPCIRGCSCYSLTSTSRRHIQGRNQTFARAGKASATVDCYYDLYACVGGRCASAVESTRVITRYACTCNGFARSQEQHQRSQCSMLMRCTSACELKRRVLASLSTLLGS